MLLREGSEMALAIILGVLGTVVLMALFRAFVFTYLWGWFIVPLGAPHIGIAHAMGLALIVGLLTARPDLEDHEGEAAKRFGKAISQGVIGALVVWGMGFILHLIVAAHA
jgi:hypothetical protein